MGSRPKTGWMTLWNLRIWTSGNKTNYMRYRSMKKKNKTPNHHSTHQWCQRKPSSSKRYCTCSTREAPARKYHSYSSGKSKSWGKLATTAVTTRAEVVITAAIDRSKNYLWSRMENRIKRVYNMNQDPQMPVIAVPGPTLTHTSHH